MHQIKINRAIKTADIGRYPQTASALLAHITPEMADRLTGKELAMVLDALYQCSQTSKAFAAREAIENGIIWDARRKKSLEIMRA